MADGGGMTGVREERYGEGHRCEAPRCANPSPTSRTCRPACRSRLWKLETDYRDRRSVRNARQRSSAQPLARYAVVQVRGSVIEVMGYSAGKSKRWVERAFGISDRGDLAAIAERHLPGVV
jgi:hypothetical protein